MLKRIHIKNFRSCKDVVLDDLGSLTALIGKNGSGKSNILRAIEAMTLLATLMPRPLRFVDIDMEFSAEIAIGTAVYRYFVGARFQKNASKQPSHTFLQELLQKKLANQWETIIHRDENSIGISGRRESIKIGPNTPCLPAIDALLPESRDLLTHVHAVLHFLKGIRYYPLDEINEASPHDRQALVSDTVYEQWKAQFLATGDWEESVVLRLLHAFLEEHPKFNELLMILGAKGLELISDIKVYPYSPPMGEGGGAAKYHSVLFRLGSQLGGGRLLLPYRELSLGTRRIIRLLAGLILDDCGLMLIEHPEDGIHRGMMRKLIGLLRVNADPKQIILSSHSSVLLNQVETESLRLVTIDRKGTKVRALNSEEIEAAENFIEQEGTLSEFVETVEE